jgi:hypothetical protein
VQLVGMRDTSTVGSARTERGGSSGGLSPRYSPPDEDEKENPFRSWHVDMEVPSAWQETFIGTVVTCPAETVTWPPPDPPQFGDVNQLTMYSAAGKSSSTVFAGTDRRGTGCRAVKRSSPFGRTGRNNQREVSARRHDQVHPVLAARTTPRIRRPSVARQDIDANGIRARHHAMGATSVSSIA